MATERFTGWVRHKRGQDWLAVVTNCGSVAEAEVKLRRIAAGKDVAITPAGQRPRRGDGMSVIDEKAIK